MQLKELVPIVVGLVWGTATAALPDYAGEQPKAVTSQATAVFAGGQPASVAAPSRPVIPVGARATIDGPWHLRHRYLTPSPPLHRSRAST